MATIGEFDPLNSTVPATKIEVTVSCRNLLDMDTFSKSDPVVVLYVQGLGTKEWREFGRTEVIDNTLNPDFVRKFVLDFFFEEKQNLRFDVTHGPDMLTQSKGNRSSSPENMAQAHMRISQGTMWIPGAPIFQNIFSSNFCVPFLTAYPPGRAEVRPCCAVLTVCWSPLLCEGLPGSDVLYVGGDHWLDWQQARKDTLVFGEEVAMERRLDFFCGSLWVVKHARDVVCDGAISRGRRAVQRAEKRSSDVLFPSRVLQLLPGDTGAFPGQTGYVSLAPCSSFSPGSFYRWHVPRISEVYTYPGWIAIKFDTDICGPQDESLLLLYSSIVHLSLSLSGIPGKKCGTIIFTAEELSNCRDIATMQLCANKLDKKDFFGKSDPFLVFYRSNEDGTFTICHKTEVIKNNLNPVWQPFTIPVRALCNGDYDRYKNNARRTVKVDVYDWDRDGSHDFIGEFTTSYRELSRGQSQFNVYEVTLLSFKVESEYTFVDFIRGGTQLNFTVAIDFTASNGNPSQPTSLHYMSPYQMNAYAMALKAVGEIIQDYDSDKLFPAYGFGAKLPPDGKISHAFPLNSNTENPNCVGIDGVLEAYFQSLRTVQLYGPTNFAPVINQVARIAKDHGHK
ncbi:hypothetical protein L3Q82_025250 [Scortum barcoo]|uniref:Uncharacterized protein n=1 Tax=Scortum barcoo TaxID=214431 RepID=A0ACB8WRT7_9TELE|nr:hypothetical protein L3Q82_025250 [Scortum barcoo]